MLCIYSFSALAQTPFETHYGKVLNSNDNVGSEFVTCSSINQDYSYVAVGSVYIPPTQIGYNGTYAIRGVRIKSDGTMLTNTFDLIQENNLNYNIYPMKIIPINNNSEYLITGYVTRVSGIYAAPLHPFPFVIKTDANLSATLFKIFTDHDGFFTDVDEIPNSGGDLLFTGAKSSLTLTTPISRVGWMMRTDPNNFTSQWIRYLHNNQINSGHNYHIVHDAITIDDNNAIICGTTNEDTHCSPPRDTFISRAFIAKIDLNDGSFVWHKSILRKFFGIRLAINDAQNKIAMAVNGNKNFEFAGVVYFDMYGNVLTKKMFESAGSITNVNFNFNSTSLFPCNISLHDNHIIQNIYFMENDEDIFISGKFLNTEVIYNSNIIGIFEMPYSTTFDYSNSSFGNLSIYKSAQTFPNMLHTFLSYDYWLVNDCAQMNAPPFYTASNTLPCNSYCNGNEVFITVTLDKAEYNGSFKEDKVWIFSNDNHVCGFENIGTTTMEIILYGEHIDIENDYIFVTPKVEDFGFDNTKPNKYIHNCMQN